MVHNDETLYQNFLYLYNTESRIIIETTIESSQLAVVFGANGERVCDIMRRLLICQGLHSTYSDDYHAHANRDRRVTGEKYVIST